MIGRSWRILFIKRIFYISVTVQIFQLPVRDVQLPLWSCLWANTEGLQVRSGISQWGRRRCHGGQWGCVLASCHLVWCHPTFSDIRGLHRGTTGLLQRNSQQNGTIQSGNSDRKKLRKMFDNPIFPIAFFSQLNISFPISAWWPGDGHCWQRDQGVPQQLRGPG